MLSTVAQDLAIARAAWQAQVEGAGVPPASTDSGIPVAALYTPLDAGVEDPEYLEQRGLPGQFPFTRGIYSTMYRGRPGRSGCTRDGGRRKTPTSGFTI